MRGSSQDGAIIAFPEAAVAISPLLMPRDNVDLHKWAVIACDQFSNNDDYWQKVAEYVGQSPSTLHYIIPEIDLHSNPRYPLAAEGEKRACRMTDDSNRHILQRTPPQAIVARRMLSDRSERLGVVIAIDLEEYEYSGAPSRIRPTERTFVDRLHARLTIRRGAPLELPHIMLLYDDREGVVLPPILHALRQRGASPLYETELMMGGGEIQGYALAQGDLLRQLIDSLAHLRASHSAGNAERALYYVGDGNHALASAKQYWMEIRDKVTRMHAARYALVELVNIHDPGLKLEPIHQVIVDKAGARFDAPGEHRDRLMAYLGAVPVGRSVRDDTDILLTAGDTQWRIPASDDHVPVVTLDRMLAPRSEEYERIFAHGDDETARLALAKGGVAVYMPALNRARLLAEIDANGVLPQKSFSLGHSTEKRYYLEARSIC